MEHPVIPPNTKVKNRMLKHGSIDPELFENGRGDQINTAKALEQALL